MTLHLRSCKKNPNASPKPKKTPVKPKEPREPDFEEDEDWLAGMTLHLRSCKKNPNASPKPKKTPVKPKEPREPDFEEDEPDTDAEWIDEEPKKESKKNHEISDDEYDTDDDISDTDSEIQCEICKQFISDEEFLLHKEACIIKSLSSLRKQKKNKK
jgi:hypothetical protein